MTESIDQQQSWWILNAQSGSQDALNELLKSIQEPLFRYISTFTNDRGAAEDILQEVFLRIYRKIGWLREPAAFRPWAYQIATREVFRHFKRERRWSDQVRDEERLALIPAERVDGNISNEMLSALPVMIENLPPRTRAVIVLRYQHEMSTAEAAAVLGIPIGTVKSRLSYGLEILRRELQKT
jgi:RNA polymerase sigma-70 factor, ECF subfamily